jgi:asparagine synthase (glutamine-hydrolysing)
MYLLSMAGQANSMSNAILGGLRQRAAALGLDTILFESDGLELRCAGGRDKHAQYATIADTGHVCVGQAREEQSALLDARDGGASGSSLLQRLGAAVLSQDAQYLRSVVAEFAVVVCDPRGTTLGMARDALGVKTLYYRSGNGWCAVSSHASLLADSDAVDFEFIAEFLAQGCVASGRTIYPDVSELLPGHVLQILPSSKALQFWTPDWYVHRRIALDEAAPRCRDLFTAAVRFAMDRATNVCGELSGGIDSSSIVSVVQDLVERGELTQGLKGTLTQVYTASSGDEREYVEEVNRAFGVPNDQIVDEWPWRSDVDQPRLTDLPTAALPWWSTHRVIESLLMKRQANTLLSGLGSDHYLDGSLSFLADLAVTGQIGLMVSELTKWAVQGRHSAWFLAQEYVMEPLLPRSVRRRRAARRFKEKWLRPAFVTRWNVLDRTPRSQQHDGPFGMKFQAGRVNQLRVIGAQLERSVYQESVEIRYPFLYRPLVEFALTLPYSVLVQPKQRKLVLREALRGTLPEQVRVRPGKGVGTDRIVWSLANESALIDWLASRPILEELGCIDSRTLQRSIASAQKGRLRRVVRLNWALALEAWLRLRTGRWLPPKPRDSAPLLTQDVGVATMC